MFNRSAVIPSFTKEYFQNTTLSRSRVTQWLFGDKQLKVSQNLPNKVYRVERYSPEKVKNGMDLRPGERHTEKEFSDISYDDIHTYTQGYLNPGLISTASSLSAARLYGNNRYNGIKFFIYEVDTTGLQGININRTLKFWDNRYPWEREIGLYHAIPKENIRLVESATGVAPFWGILGRWINSGLYGV